MRLGTAIDFAALNERALQHLPQVLEDLLGMDIKVVGKEIQMLNPRRPDGEHGSFAINSETGRWADFAQEDAKGGDVTSLVAYLRDLDQRFAAVQLERFLDNLSPAPLTRPRATQAEHPAAPALPAVPRLTSPTCQPTAVAKSPASPAEKVPPLRVFVGRGVPTVYRYNDADGLPIAAVCRYPGKVFLQQCLARTQQGTLEWINEAPAVPRPLYGLDRLAAKPKADVLVCEGEKATDAAGKLFPDMVAITTSGGANSPGKSDFSPLAGRRIFISPDLDEPGEAYKDSVLNLARSAGATPVAVLRFRPEHFGQDLNGQPRDVPKGYDLAEALAEGWTAEKLATLGPVLWEEVPRLERQPHSVNAPTAATSNQTVPPSQDDKLTQLQQCFAFAELHFGGRLLHDGSGFRTYRDGYWPMLDQQVDIERALVAHIGAKASARTVSEMVRLLRMAYANRAELLDSPKQVICVLNGTLDPRTSQLRKHSPDDYISNRVLVEWAPEATCPLWLQTLEEIFAPDDDKASKIGLIQEFIGYCLIADTSMHKFLWMVGGGGNGKSLVLGVIEKIVGRENISHAQIERIQDTNVRAELKGKLLNISSEMSAQSTVSDGYLKQIVSGDTIEAERKFERPFSFKPFVRLIGATNELPRLLDHSEGFFRRAMILTFNRRFAEHEQDRNRSTLLEAELPGILAWAVRGLQALLGRQGFVLPPSSTAAIAQYRVESDPVQQFVEERVQSPTSEKDLVAAHALFVAFDEWRSNRGYMRMTTTSLKRRLEALGFVQVRTQRGRFWRLRLVDAFEALNQAEPGSSGPAKARYSTLAAAFQV